MGDIPADAGYPGYPEQVWYLMSDDEDDAELDQDEDDTDLHQEGCRCGNVCMDCLGMSNRDFF